MANPKMPRLNSKEFDPDKGLPLIAERPLGFPKRGQGAADKATENHQLYDRGKPVEISHDPGGYRKRKWVPKGTKRSDKF